MNLESSLMIQKIGIITLGISIGVLMIYFIGLFHDYINNRRKQNE